MTIACVQCGGPVGEELATGAVRMTQGGRRFILFDGIMSVECPHRRHRAGAGEARRCGQMNIIRAEAGSPLPPDIVKASMHVVH